MKKTSDCLNFEAMNSPMFSPISKNRRNSKEKKNVGDVLDFNTSQIEIGKYILFEIGRPKKNMYKISYLGHLEKKNKHGIYYI